MLLRQDKGIRTVGAVRIKAMQFFIAAAAAAHLHGMIGRRLQTVSGAACLPL